LSRKRARGRAAARAAAESPDSAAREALPPAIPAGRRALFLGITLALPLLLLLGVEVAIRLLRPSGGLPLFVTAPVGGGRYLSANPAVGRRYFSGTTSAPAPPREVFATEKPANGFRAFVLGESTTAGFPYPHNGTFSRVLQDALRDALTDDSVEVINLGIAATNSFTVADLAREVADQDPDVVIIYAGHNEYYGVLGAASTQGAATPALIRLSLWLQRARTYLAVRNLLTGRGANAAADSAPSFMEVLARDQYVALGDARYLRGVQQFGDNLSRTLRHFRDRGIPVLVASLASNLRDQPPFAAPPNDAPDGARAIYTAARAALAAGDTAGARTLFVAARDADVVRFRAPTAFDSVVRAAATAAGATYVPVRERFDTAAHAGIPGAELFLEHVHPNRRGTVVIAQAFFDALRDAQFFGHTATGTLQPWLLYEQRMALTPFDERVAEHTVRTLATRWPFVPASESRDYRGTYRPVDFADSLAFTVSRGGERWETAKLTLGQRLAAAGAYAAAAAEYAGLVRDLPLSELPLRMLARALAAGGRAAAADTVLQRALAVEPTAAAAFDLARIRLTEQRVAEAIPLLEQATGLDPTHVAAWYQLSLAYGLTRNLALARSAAIRAARLNPAYPGLQGWMATIGVKP
jgi:lysophospholipase L1-like esterase